MSKATDDVLADRPAAHFAAGPATEGSEVERMFDAIAGKGAIAGAT